ncbi:formate dehydrogenase beta subunit [Rhodobium orientis]|uniref:Oxidoreductase n=1 Tax=Rhodobium orientis TaxID=34017 RepID=A0A327JWL6_9HYPH|nr:FAD-dependent oxidoreductase [Rhodobium orientis]MBB4304594.1 formate dehydrogenase beta subunit [Rhodobium orientis]MBK5951372.1 oxidoreductase [Rhodobium orientis]RAI27568.1 oxidoreductase [Rhodobium orientis]
MAQVAFGVWDGVVHDASKRAGDAQSSISALKNFNEFDDGNPIRAFFGDRGFFVFDETVSLVDGLFHYMNKAAEESCGACTPCRMGTVLVRDALDAMRRGIDSPLDFDEIEILGEQMTETSLCGLGKTCSVALLDVIRNFRDRIEKEVAVKRPIRAQHGMAYMTAPCIEACPSKINVPRYIDYIRDGKPENSLGVLLQKYPMAATCGRVCVRYCEEACRRKFVDEAVGIKTLKRYVADQQKGPNALKFTRDMIRKPLADGMRVAVVGAGPAGISCAYHLLLQGYHVDLFEKHEQAGGMAQIGIPSYRLPKDTLAMETDIIAALGGRFLFGQQLGRDFTVEDLFARGYKAVFLGLGCQAGTALGVEGEEHARGGYHRGIDFLLKVHDHVAGVRNLDLSGEVVVVGAGNVAMDCVRSAVRLGADNVHVVYRRTRQDMPADDEEIVAADHEGIHLHTLTNPTRILTEDGNVVGVELVKMEQTEPDESGRRKVRPIPGTEYTIPCDTIVAAIGQQVEDEAMVESDGIAFNRWKCVETDDALLTSRPGVFAGGDCVTGPSTLIYAMSAGLQAARNINDWIQLGTIRFFKRTRMRQLLEDNRILANDVVETPVRAAYRVHNPALDPELRKHMFGEVEQTISNREAYAEAQRCMRCYRVYSVITQHSIPEGAV